MASISRYPVEELQQFSNTRIPGESCLYSSQTAARPLLTTTLLPLYSHGHPAPPTVTSIRLLIPLSCCDDAAPILIASLGGEEKAKEIAGGTRWWQVRGLAGVDANWVANKKDWNRADRMRRNSEASRSRASSFASNGSTPSTAASDSDRSTAVGGDSDTYTADLDPMRCMLYFHGGK